jgi:hypothetical protein
MTDFHLAICYLYFDLDGDCFSSYRVTKCYKLYAVRTEHIYGPLIENTCSLLMRGKYARQLLSSHIFSIHCLQTATLSQWLEEKV